MIIIFIKPTHNTQQTNQLTITAIKERRRKTTIKILHIMLLIIIDEIIVIWEIIFVAKVKFFLNIYIK